MQGCELGIDESPEPKVYINVSTGAWRRQSSQGYAWTLTCIEAKLELHNLSVHKVAKLSEVIEKFCPEWCVIGFTYCLTEYILKNYIPVPTISKFVNAPYMLHWAQRLKKYLSMAILTYQLMDGMSTIIKHIVQMRFRLASSNLNLKHGFKA